jgi:glycosyltransferase involved in cell wall biosynthesis
MRLAITSIIHDPEKLAALATAGQRKVAERFTWGAKAAQVKRVYEAVLSGTTDLTNILGELD